MAVDRGLDCDVVNFPNSPQHEYLSYMCSTSLFVLECIRDIQKKKTRKINSGTGMPHGTDLLCAM